MEPLPIVEFDRLVTIAPMLLRRRMSRLIRTTEKLVEGVAETRSSSVWMLSTPTANWPTFPVSRPPASMGTARLLFKPMRRL